MSPAAAALSRLATRRALGGRFFFGQAAEGHVSAVAVHLDFDADGGGGHAAFAGGGAVVAFAAGGEGFPGGETGGGVAAGVVPVVVAAAGGEVGFGAGGFMVGWGDGGYERNGGDGAGEDGVVGAETGAGVGSVSVVCK